MEQLTNGQPETIVEFRHITKRFPGIVTNDDINLAVRKGEIFALLGENGAVGVAKEIGWKANAGKNFTVDLGLNGWAGKQQGISGNVGFEWKF